MPQPSISVQPAVLRLPNRVASRCRWDRWALSGPLNKNRETGLGPVCKGMLVFVEEKTASKRCILRSWSLQLRACLEFELDSMNTLGKVGNSERSSVGSILRTAFNFLKGPGILIRASLDDINKGSHVRMQSVSLKIGLALLAPHDACERRKASARGCRGPHYSDDAQVPFDDELVEGGPLIFHAEPRAQFICWKLDCGGYTGAPFSHCMASQSANLQKHWTCCGKDPGISCLIRFATSIFLTLTCAVPRLSAQAPRGQEHR